MAAMQTTKKEVGDEFGSDDSGTDSLYIDLGNHSGEPADDISTPPSIIKCEPREVETNQPVFPMRRERFPIYEREQIENYESIKPAEKVPSHSTPKPKSSSALKPVTSKTTSADQYEPLKLGNVPATSIYKPPVISDYPPPFTPSYGVPLPMAGLYQPQMFLPSPTPSPFMPFPSPMTHIPAWTHPVPNTVPQFETTSPVEHTNSVDEGRCSPGSDDTGRSSPVSTDGRSSPADSLSSRSSSGVSSSASSPSPKKPSPEKSPHIPSRTPGGRTCYTPQQVRVMEKVFSESRYPDYDVLDKMSADLGIPVKKIKVWFQNKRARNKPERVMPNMAAMASLPFPMGYPMIPAFPGYPAYPVMFPPGHC